MSDRPRPDVTATSRDAKDAAHHSPAASCKGEVNSVTHPLTPGPRAASTASAMLEDYYEGLLTEQDFEQLAPVGRIASGFTRRRVRLVGASDEQHASEPIAAN